MKKTVLVSVQIIDLDIPDEPKHVVTKHVMVDPQYPFSGGVDVMVEVTDALDDLAEDRFELDAEEQRADMIDAEAKEYGYDMRHKNDLQG